MGTKFDKILQAVKAHLVDVIKPNVNDWNAKGVWPRTVSDMAGAAGLANALMDRGAFFGSIHNTLAHILWGDSLWMSRFDGWQPPTDEAGIVIANWVDLKQERMAADARFINWGERVQLNDLQGDLAWYSGALKCDLVKPRAVCVMQIFNHQTHHRGQVHAMLTAASATPHDTDLAFIPDE